MKAQSWTWLAAVGLLWSLCAGCATRHTRAEIPLGEWSGQGTCLLRQWPADGSENEPPELFKHQSYKTRLTIEAAPEEGAVRLEIVTLRGEMPPLDGDRTHLILFLEQRDAAADDTIATYCVTQMSLALEDGPPEVREGPPAPVTASCLVLEGELILRIHYMEGFVDTFRFRGDRLYKDGTFFPEDSDGLVHWSEVLRRR